MKVVVGHENLDLDALGGMVLARHLHPGAVLVQVGGLEGRMQEVVNLYADHLGLVPAERVPLEEVREVAVVDTQSRRRIGPFAELVGRVPFFVYDHHPVEEDPIPAVGGVVDRVGAATTLIAQILRDRGVELRPHEADLALAGIMEDTGRFTYAGTTAADLEAAAWLVRQGADPARIRGFVEGKLAPEAREVLEELLKSAEVVEVGPYRAVIAEARKEGYVPALAPLAHTVADLYDADAVFLLFRLGDQRLVIARSRRGLDVDRVLRRALGRGGGHPRAAFARVDLPLDRVREKLLAALREEPLREPTLAERMTRGVEGMRGNPTVSQALAEMRRRGYGGMPFFEGERVIGVLRRRDLERAAHLGMGEAPAKGFLHPAVILPETASVSRAERALKEGAGRVLVADSEGRVVGIFTRTDLYQKQDAEPDLAEEVYRRLPAAAREAVGYLVERFPDARVYLVGGAVRDALLGKISPDVDLVVEGVDPGEAARALAASFGGRVARHPEFGTARAELEGGLRLDLAAPREETYSHPGALPQVRPSSIERDLSRRDFTVNAMAVRLFPEPREFLDPVGGLGDLKRRRLVPITPVAFVEDPSRVLRGVRLAERLGLEIPGEVERAMRSGLVPEVLSRASKSRLKDELLLSLAEPAPVAVLRRLAGLGALGRVFGLELGPEDWEALSRLEAAAPEEEVPPEAYLYLLAAAHPDPEALVREFGLPRQYAEGARVLGEPPDDPEVVRRLGPAFVRAFLARYPEREGWLSPRRRRLRGRDLLELGLKPGPVVGRVLDEVARARARGEVASFEDELELARKLVERYGSSGTSE